MKRSFVAMLTLVALACGGEQAASQSSGAQSGTTESPASGEAEAASANRAEMTSEQACEIMKSGILNEAFESNEESWNYRPASEYVPQALCTATGRSPDGSSSYEVSLMIMRADFQSPAEAVASLEGTVKSLTEGMTIQAGGKEYTKQVEFEPFIDGVGDQAAWAPKLNELSVADEATRFAVTVTGFADNAENKAKAIELARLVAEAL